MCRGVGIKMTEALYQAPSLSQMLPSIVFAQNLPSIVCSHVLDPQPGQLVIDMCAAPGMICFLFYSRCVHVCVCVCMFVYVCV